MTTLYRSLADADTTVAAGFLSGRVEPREVRARYDGDVDLAMTSLAQASIQAGGELATARQITDITKQLPVYTGLVEQARANNRQGLAVGVTYLRLASDLMQNRILPQAAELQRRQAAGGRWLRQPRPAPDQIAPTQSVRVRRAGAGSDHGAAGPDRREPRAGPHLHHHRGGLRRPVQRLARNGGALDAARALATDQVGRDLVDVAAREASTYSSAHQRVRTLDANAQYAEAVDAAVSTDETSAATAFDQLDKALIRAVAHERGALGSEMHQAQRQLTGLPTATGALALAAAVGVALGIRQRLEEYR